MNKSFTDLTDLEKHLYYEYKSWCKSTAPMAYKLHMAQGYADKLSEKGLSYLIQ